MLVPPRRGQKNKSKVLPHVNNGLCFQLVEIWNDTDSKSYGILDASSSTNDKCYVWKSTNLVPELIPKDNLRAIHLPHPPKIAYHEFSATIGGIGKHLRWKVVMSKKKMKDECQLFVSNITSKENFQKFIEEQIRPFGFCTFEYVTDDSNIATTVKVPNHNDLTFVAAALHLANYNAIPLNDDMASYGALGLERYDRSEHTWWNQNPKTAGPLRDTHKWKYSFLPDNWKELPFTWTSMASNIKVDSGEMKHIPLPLKNYVADHYAEKASNEEERNLWKSFKTEKHCVTSRLTSDQNKQVLIAAYWSYIAPFHKHITDLSLLLQFRYMLHGYIGREVGGYRQLAKYIGHGAYCRKFKNKPQYNVENLNMELKNKFLQKDGELLGNGFKGTRGKYGHYNFPKYNPGKKMKRTLESEINIREYPSNKFEEYAKKRKHK
tara:strand:+ start:586 stop:1890 length:1305 start_codon:yes stop_codon:yes gene_type:complete